jgi:hypothetical protein
MFLFYGLTMVLFIPEVFINCPEIMRAGCKTAIYKLWVPAVPLSQ